MEGINHAQINRDRQADPLYQATYRYEKRLRSYETAIIILLGIIFVLIAIGSK